MRQIAMAVGLFCAAILTANALLAEEPKKEEKQQSKKRLGELMKTTFQGEKSPLVRAEAELKRDKPDWNQLTEDAKAFDEMADAVKWLTTQTYQWRNYGEPANYMKHAKAFSKAVGDKDKKTATEAIVGIQASCFDCHGVYYPSLRDRSAPRDH